MSSLIEAYAPERQGRVFGFFDKLYAWPHTHRGADYRKQEPGGHWSVVTDAVAIEGGVVTYAGPAPGGKLGGTVVIRTNRRTGTGVYESHSHTVPTVKRGDRVRPGDRIGRNAGPNDLSIWRGTSWRGSHDHVVFSDFSDGAWNTSRPVFDPAPIIRAALAQPAGGGSSPAPTTPSTTPTTPPAAEIEVLIMSATPFIAKVKKDNGGSKLFLVQPNPLAASDPKAIPFLAFGWSGDSKDLPVMDATADWIYNYLQMRVASINRS